MSCCPVRFALVVLLCLAPTDWGAAADPLSDGLPTVAIEEEVYRFTSADNGAGPMWCFGNSCIVRRDGHVYAAALHTQPAAKPLNNCQPAVLLRQGDGWKEVYRASGLTREPSPLGLIQGGPLLLSVNPTAVPGAYSGPSRPSVIAIAEAAQRWEPTWQGAPPFTEHSYRSFVVDGSRGEVLLMQNIGYTHSAWSFRDARGQWSAQGKLDWPRDDAGRPIRICYPAVALRGGRVCLLGVSDVVEPRKDWQKFKRSLTNREWDYVFRRLYYTECADIRTGRFRDWVEVANVESTAGGLFPNDLVIHEDGRVRLLWHQRQLDARLREKFFPETPQRIALEMAVLENGRIAERTTVLEQREGVPGPSPGRGRFHLTPEKRLWVIGYASGLTAPKSSTATQDNLLTEIAAGVPQHPIRLRMQYPLASFFTNTVRAGCLPSRHLDLLGRVGDTMRYARIDLP